MTRSIMFRGTQYHVPDTRYLARSIMFLHTHDALQAEERITSGKKGPAKTESSQTGSQGASNRTTRAIGVCTIPLFAFLLIQTDKTVKPPYDGEQHHATERCRDAYEEQDDERYRDTYKEQK